MRDNKFKSVDFNNHKKQLFFVYTTGKKVSVHYSQLGINSNIVKAWVDHETRDRSIGLEFENGSKDYLPYDQPLELVKDADYLLQNHIELVISYIKDEI